MPHYHASRSRQTLCRFALSFFLVNICLALLIGINYLPVLPKFHAMVNSTSTYLLLMLFLAISFITQITILFFSACLLIIFLALLIPRAAFVIALSVIFVTTLIFVLIADSVVFSLYYMHYLSVAWDIFKVNAFSHVISFSIFEVAELIGASILLILIETLIAWQVWRHITKKPSRKWGYALPTVLILCFLTSYSVNSLARLAPASYGLNDQQNDLVIKATRFIPYYDDIYRLIMPIHSAVREIHTPTGKVDLQIHDNNQSLDYPKQRLQCEKVKKPLNILIIAIDTWRYDTMDPTVTPAIYQFAQKTLQFQNHWSGGNCTKAGLFSLFYGIPANYWDAFLKAERGPEMIRQFAKANYHLAIFTSAQLNFPAFDKTIFHDVNDLIIRMPGKTTVARDQEITQAFKKFLHTRNPDQPFFSFLFYDAVHNYCEQTTPDKHPFNPWLPACNRITLTDHSDPKLYVNRYKNAVYFVDNEIKQVLAALQQQHLLDNTVVILTSDHGEEINDHHSGYWQHASAYTSYQLHVPLLIYWPGQKPKTYTHFTTHYDVVPTLMTKALDCQSPLKDYTIGQSLFSKDLRPVLISGSYADYAIISKNQIVRVYSGGDYVVNDQYGQTVLSCPLNTPPLQQAFHYLNTYFKQKN